MDLPDDYYWQDNLFEYDGDEGEEGEEGETGPTRPHPPEGNDGYSPTDELEIDDIPF